MKMLYTLQQINQLNNISFGQIKDDVCSTSQIRSLESGREVKMKFLIVVVD